MLADFFSPAKLDGWSVLFAVIVAVVGWIVSGLAKRGTRRLIVRVWPTVKDSVAMLVARIIRYAILLIVLGVVLTILGAPLQPILAATLLVAAIAILALRGLAENLGAGLVIQARHVVRVGDEIEIVGHLGVVKELNGRSVIIHAANGRSVRIPNAQILDHPLVNLSERQLYRSEIEVRVEGARPHGESHDLIMAALDANDRIRSVPGVQALLARHSPESTTFLVRFWHEPRHRAEIRSSAARTVVDALEAEGIAVAVDWRVPPPPLTHPSDL